MRILLLGEYGFGNYAGEADLPPIVRVLGSEFHNPSFTVLSIDPEETERFYGIRCCHLLSPAVLIEILKSDMCVAAGGAVFDSSIMKRLNLLSVYLLTLLLTARILKRKVRIYGIGVYNSTSPVKNLLLSVFNRAEKISVRDEYSKRYLKSIGIHRDLALVRCPAENIKAIDENKFKKVIEKEGIRLSRPFIIFSLRTMNRPETDTELAVRFSNVIKWCMDKLDSNILLLPASRHKYKKSEDDYRFMKKILERPDNNRYRNRISVIKDRYSPDVLAGIVKYADLVVSMRHHILAICEAVTTKYVAVVCHEKIAAFLEGKNRKGIQIDEKLEETLKKYINYHGQKSVALLTKSLKIK